jgi:choline kinase
MRAIVLAAGRGTRLNSAIPKTLTRLASGETILGRQLAELEHHMRIDEVLVVVGYGCQLVMENFPGATYVYNPSYASENTAKSMARALSRLDDDVITLNGDLVFRSGMLDQLIACPTSGAAVNRAPVGDEEMKYVVAPSGHITAISKQVSGGAGEAVGANLIRRHDVPNVLRGLQACADLDYFERGFELAIGSGVRFAPVVIGDDDCVEIDFPGDLIRSGELLRRWGDASPLP